MTLRDELIFMAVGMKTTSAMEKKATHLCSLVEQGIIQSSSAKQHFKNWLKQQEDFIEEMQSLNEQFSKQFRDGTRYYISKGRMKKMVHKEAESFVAIDPTVYGYIDTSKFDVNGGDRG